MKLYEAKNIIKDIFENSFDKKKFTYFVENLLKNLEIKPFGNGGAYTGNLIPRAFQSIIRKMERIGKFEDEEGNLIDVLIVELNREHSIEYARATQRNFIRWYLNGSRGNQFKDAALVAFHTQKSSDWRFSLIKMQYSLKKGKDVFTPAKRSSFLVGEKGKSHTAQQQLVGLLKKDYPPSLSDLEDAFNIEAVSDEFYEKYKAQLFNLKEALDKIVEKDNIIKTEFEQKNIDTLNFAKKLLGQIGFLYFLQRKGWLGLEKGQSYGKGNRNFMRDLFEQAKSKGENFFNDYLEFLFYDALSKKRTTDFYEKFNCRIPFLNGGLFDPINFYDWEKTDIIIPNELFSNKNDDDEEGTGILDVFDLYNFTVKEDEPLETEVAIDPEMLGKVFERMLEVKERKSKGAFYTPREIVHYMAQRSLLYYLENKLKDKVTKTELETFIRFGELIIDKDIAIETGKLKESNNKYQIPESVRSNADIIDKALENIKICDPAVGSGAFPVGVMNEIVKLRNLLTPFINSPLIEGNTPSSFHSDTPLQEGNRTPYFFKANAIKHSIYGVDIDAGAVEIAKLRLWLSLVVDESNINRIEPLPNLEYKIVRGNSLLGYPYEPRGLKQIELLKERYYSLTDKNEKQKLKTEIDEKIHKMFANFKKRLGYKVDFDFKINFSEVFTQKRGFDIVIGNPPYVSTKGTNATNKKTLKKVYDFADDLYSHFFFKSFEILRDSGVLSFITSNTFLTINTKKNVRQLLQKNRIVEIIKTADVFDAMVSPAITIALKIEGKENYTLFFKDAIGDFLKPKIYQIDIDVFRNSINNVFFPPTEFNLKFYKKYNKKLNELYNKWWPKIETSKKITQNKIELEKFRNSLKEGDIVLLGTVTEGGQGLATANNGRFVGVRQNTKKAESILKSRPDKLYKAVTQHKIPLEIKNKEEAKAYLDNMTETEVWQFFDGLKEKYGRDIFGQGYLYRIVPPELVADVDLLSEDEKKNGIDKSKTYFVKYDKGDKDGNRWYLETPFVIDWSKESVKWLFQNSGKKGQGMPVVRNPQFYFREGFCWTNVLNPHARLIKTRIKEKSVNDVGSMALSSISNKFPNYYFISLLNSTFIFDYYRNFINNTVNIQINDIRQLPIIVPNNEQLQQFKELFNKAVSIKKKQFACKIDKNTAKAELNKIQKILDEMVLDLYDMI